MRKYGTWICYAVYLCMALIPSPDCLGLVTLIVMFVMLGTHLSMGIQAPYKSSAAVSAIMYLMTIMALIQAGYLIARYVYQFGDLANWFSNQFWGEFELDKILTVRELGLRRYVNDDYAGDLYLSLLDSFAMLLLTVIQIGFLSDLAQELRGKEEFVLSVRSAGTLGRTTAGGRRLGADFGSTIGNTVQSLSKDQTDKLAQAPIDHDD